MATGDDAAAGGMSLVSGSALANTIHTLINATRDYIANGPSFWKSGIKVPIAKGGTNATTAADARTNLGAVAAADVWDGVSSIAGKITKWDGSGRIPVAAGAASNDAVALFQMNNAVATKVSKTGDTMTGDLTISGSGHHLYVTAASAATSGYTVAYIDGDGRLSKGASSRRFKKFISHIIPSSLGDLFPALARFQMKQGDGSWRYGYIAEDLAENPATQPFVVYDRDGLPESIDFIGLLIAQNAQLHERLTALEARA